MNRILIILALAAALLLAAGTAVTRYGAGKYKAGQQEVQSRWDQQVNADQQQALSEAAENAKETLRRLTAQKAKDDEDEKRLLGMQRERDAAVDAAGRVRADLAGFIVAHRSAATSSAATESERQAAYDASMRALSELHRRIDEVAGRYAGAFDAARLRGLACEADYEELMPKKKTPG